MAYIGRSKPTAVPLLMLTGIPEITKFTRQL